MHSRALWRHAALVAAIVGAGVSAYLLVEYLSGQGGICITGSGCDEVRFSAYAYPLGIPMPAFGLVFYVVAALVAWRSLRPAPILGISPRIALALLGVAGLAVSAVLTGLEAFVIRAFCTWCLVQAAASVVLAISAFIGLGGRQAPAPATSPGASRRAQRQATRAMEDERGSLRRSGLLASAGMAILVAGLLAGGAVATSTPSASVTPGSNLAPSAAPRTGSGPVLVVEFADYQCPACSVVAPELQKLVDDGSITLVYRNFPLPQHAHAVSTAKAALAAGTQGKFWQMHDLLFSTQASWQNLSTDQAQAYFTQLATQVGLDVAAWQQAMSSSAVQKQLTADSNAARDLNLPGTPSLFINGKAYSGGLSLSEIRSAVTAAAG